MRPENEVVDLAQKTLARVLPGALVTFLGTMLILATGFLLLTEGAAALRLLTSDLPQPFRSLTYFVLLAGPLVILCWSGRKVMGYVIARMSTLQKE